MSLKLTMQRNVKLSNLNMRFGNQLNLLQPPVGECQVFITDIRNCKNPEDEEQRVDRELANIRGKFKAEKNLTGKSHIDNACNRMVFIPAVHNVTPFGFMQITKRGSMCGSYFTSTCLVTM